MTDPVSPRQPLVLPPNFRDVTAERIRTITGIVGATAAKERWQKLPPWPPVAGSRVDPVAEREPGSTRLRVGSSKASNHAQGTVSAKIIPARRAGQVFGTLSQRIFAFGRGGECRELKGRIWLHRGGDEGQRLRHRATGHPRARRARRGDAGRCLGAAFSAKRRTPAERKGTAGAR
jgi:hypothetical protein